MRTIRIVAAVLLVACLAGGSWGWYAGWFDRLGTGDRSLGPWTIGEYHNVRWQRSGGEVAISGGGMGGGLFFRTALDPAKRYRLVIAGEPVSGQASLRLQRDARELQWLSIPAGGFDTVIAGAHALEALIYSDSPFSYRLRTIAIEPCTKCMTEPEQIALAQRFAPDAEIALLGNPVVATEDPAPGSPHPSSVLSVIGAANPAGLYFRYRLTPALKYRLSISGRNQVGRANLRLTRDGVAPEYLTAPDGRQTLVITGVARLEALIYADSTFDYGLDNLSVVEDADAITDERLKEIILAARPRLGEALQNRETLAAVQQLMEWTAGHVSRDFRPDAIATNTAAIAAMSAGQGYQSVWESGAGGAAGGAFAMYFAKILNLFGFDALTVDLGYQGTPVTHVTTVLPVETQGKYRFYVFDPTYAGTFTDHETGDRLDLDQVAGRLGSAEAPVEFATAPLHRTVFVPPSEEAYFRGLFADLHDRYSCTSDTDAGPSRAACEVSPYDYRVEQALWRPALQRLSLPTSGNLFMTLLKSPLLGITDFGAGGKKIDAAHAELARSLARLHAVP